MIRISVGAPMTPNKTFACNDAKSMEGGLLLVKARGWGLFERLGCSPLPQPLKILKVSSHSGTIFYVKPHCYLSHLLLLFLKIWSDQVARMYEVSEGGSRKLERKVTVQTGDLRGVSGETRCIWGPKPKCEVTQSARIRWLILPSEGTVPSCRAGEGKSLNEMPQCDLLTSCHIFSIIWKV